MWIKSGCIVCLLLLNFYKSECTSGLIVFDDMIMESGLYKRLFGDDFSEKRTRRAAPSKSSRIGIWDIYKGRNGTWLVPYVFDRNISGHGIKDTILQAMEEIESKSCLKFIPRKKQKFYVKFQDVGVRTCAAYTGRVPELFQPNKITLYREACYGFDTILHETMHALGFRHEHQRPDRDEYIKIHYKNIRNKKDKDWFKKSKPYMINSHGSTYDYASIMHYHPRAYAKPGTVTITKKNGQPLPWRTIKGLSKSDVEQLNAVYRCKAVAVKECKDEYAVEACQRKLVKGACTSSPTVMKKNCQATCKLCGCTDLIDCWARKTNGDCYAALTVNTMKAKCPVTCGFCGKGCVDVATDCKRYLTKKKTCRGKLSFLAENCRKTCGFCITRN